MTQRNVEIQLQALDLIEHRQTGLVSDEVVAADAKQSDEVEPTNNGENGDIESPPVVVDTPPDKELFSTIESVLSREQQAAATDAEPDVEETADKFKRLNLFFDKEQARLS